MNFHLLLENDQRRLDISISRLFCFVMFCVWQMGIIYFIGPSLNIDGRTPLPISADNVTLLIVLGYVLSIIAMIIIPKKIILLSRTSCVVALVSAVALFVPLPAEILTILLYLQCFCCCFMIGFESYTLAYVFAQQSITKHLLIAYPIGYIMIAFIQNDFFQIPFSIFRILMVVMLVLLTYFYFSIPLSAGIRFIKKEDKFILPKRFFGAFLLLSFLAALLGVIAPAAAAEVEHGVFVTYISCAISSLILYWISLKTKRHPICFVPYIIGISAIGYLLLVVSEHIPSISLLAIILIGPGMSACALIPLFGMLLVKEYPSKMIVPAWITLAMVAVIVQSVLVEIFRTSTVLLNLSYLVIVIILAIIFILSEPYLLYSMQRKFDEKTPTVEAEISDEKYIDQSVSLFNTLTKRESEISDLISYGYSNSDIAKLLFISEHTVKDHTKNIYRKLDVHSRYELTALINRTKEKNA